MFARLICAVLLAVATLGGCATASLLDNMALAPDVLTIAPEVLGGRTVEQRLSMRWSGGERSMETVVEIADGKLNLVALAFGMRLVSLEYDGITVDETRQTPMAPPGKRMVNDLLLVAAPLEDLRRALPEKWTVTERQASEAGAAFLRREISENGKTQVVIDYFSGSPWQGRVMVEHRALGYQLILDSHEL
ncbi:MAG: DUF3261 domain-containing protein [Zoogloeaceae bacterium]|jgi:hypothetical protein|nr:DUF3261 domain-containing protein [Zoogloeaceae bacterium]